MAIDNIPVPTANPNTQDSRMETQDNKEYEIQSGAADVQRGIIQTPSFFGDQSITQNFQTFQKAVNKAAEFAGAAMVMRNELVPARKPEDARFHLTTDEYKELERKARSISGYSNIPNDVVEDFLIILCYINDIRDMRVIADAVQIPELDDPAILRQPMAIFAIPRLEKIAFCASALEGLINLFRKYLYAAQYTPNTAGEDSGDILKNIGNMVSGMGQAGALLQMASGTAENSLGSFMSELITGNRIPMTVIAKNPNLQAPSFIGKALFGESNNPLSNIDIDQLFAKPIAVFPKPSSGSGTTSFGLQNLNSFSNNMSLNGLVSKMLTGNAEFDEASKKFRQVKNIVDKIESMSGAKGTDMLDIRRADTAIPMMSAISAAMSGTDSSPFGKDTFRQGWMVSNSVSNVLQNNNDPFFEAVKRFL